MDPALPQPDRRDSVIELRQVFEAEDFGEAYTPEVAEQERRTRAIVEGQLTRTGVAFHRYDTRGTHHP